MDIFLNNLQFKDLKTKLISRVPLPVCEKKGYYGPGEGGGEGFGVSFATKNAGKGPKINDYHV